MLLQDVQVLTLYRGLYTTARRSSPVPQLQCVGGSAGCHAFVPEVVQCQNKGWDGMDVQVRFISAFRCLILPNGTNTRNARIKWSITNCIHGSQFSDSVENLRGGKIWWRKLIGGVHDPHRTVCPICFSFKIGQLGPCSFEHLCRERNSAAVWNSMNINQRSGGVKWLKS